MNKRNLILIVSLIITILILSSCTDKEEKINTYGKKGETPNPDYTVVEAPALNMEISYPTN